jgi:hypothetical protein
MTSGIMAMLRYSDASAMIDVLCRVFVFERQFLRNEPGRTIARAPRSHHGGMVIAGPGQIRPVRFARV